METTVVGGMKPKYDDSDMLSYVYLIGGFNYVYMLCSSIEIKKWDADLQWQAYVQGSLETTTNQQEHGRSTG